MDEESMLQHQEALLIQQLELVRAQLKFVRLIKSEQKKGVAPCLTSTSQLVGTSSTEPKMVISTPFSSEIKVEASPVQTEAGKDPSNPLKADALPKSIKVDSTTIKVTEEIKQLINLRPNSGNSIPQNGVKSTDSQSSDKGILIPNKNSKPYYVVFNGPNRGIFETWDIAKRAVEGISNCQHKKFKNFLEAKTAANIYSRINELPELHLICNAETLRPANFAAALKSKKEKDSKSILGRLPYKIDFHKNNGSQLIEFSKEVFDYLYKHARQAGEDLLVEEKLFTKDGKNLSYFNFIKGADPEQVAECFDYGLVKFIYPSQNLKEISLFPKSVYKAVKNFRTKVLKSEKDIFLKISSSIPIWDEDQSVICRPQHLIFIGISKEEKYTPSIPSPCSLGEVDLFPLGIKKLEEHLKQIFSFTKDDHVYVNFEDKNHLVYSKSGKAICQKDEESILSHQQQYARGLYMVHHDRRICSSVRKKTAVPCTTCDSTKESGPSALEKDALPTQNDKSPKAKEDA